MASVTPDLRLSSQPQSIIALRPVPNYTAWIIIRCGTAGTQI